MTFNFLDALGTANVRIGEQTSMIEERAEQAKNQELIDKLILNHAKPASEVAELLKMNKVQFKDFVLKQQKLGVIEEVIKSSNKYQYTLRHIINLMDAAGITAWRDKHSKTIVMAISNLKGGTGKTTTAASLAAAFSLNLRLRKRVLLVDLDPQGSQSQHANINLEAHAELLTAVDLMLGEYEEDSIYSHLRESQSHVQIVQESIIDTHIPNFKVLPADPADERFNSIAWENFIEEIKVNPDAEMRAVSLLKDKVIEPLKDDFDIIIIDTAPQTNPLVWSAIEASNAMLTPITPHSLDWKATQKFLSLMPDTLQQLPSKGENIKWWKCLATNFDDEYNRDKDILDLMKDALGSDLLNTQICRSQAFEKAAAKRCTAFDFKPSDGEVPKKQLDKALLSLAQVEREISLSIEDISTDK